MLNVLKNEPARVVAFVIAALGVATAFGLGITDGQQAATVALVGATLALGGGEAVRAQVTPTAKLADQSLAAEPAPLVDVPNAKPAKKAAAKRPAKKAAPKVTGD
jgi:hypothetical protein